MAELQQAMEILRVWGGGALPQQVVLRTTWDDPGSWGLLLVDVARHAANAYARAGLNPEESIARIRQAWDAEWSAPTDAPAELR